MCRPYVVLILAMLCLLLESPTEANANPPRRVVYFPPPVIYPGTSVMVPAVVPPVSGSLYYNAYSYPYAPFWVGGYGYPYFAYRPRVYYPPVAGFYGRYWRR